MIRPYLFLLTLAAITITARSGAEISARPASALSQDERIKNHRQKIEKQIQLHREQRGATRSGTQCGPVPVAPVPAQPSVQVGDTDMLGLPEFVTRRALDTSDSKSRSPSLADHIDRVSTSSAGITLAFAGAPAARVLDSISRQSGLRVGARGRAATSPISIVVRDTSVVEVLSVLLASCPDCVLYAPDESGALELWNRTDFRRRVMTGYVARRIFDVRHIALEDAHRAVASLLTQGIGTVVPIPSNNKLVVSDIPWVLNEVEEFLPQIDQKPLSLTAPSGRETTY